MTNDSHRDRAERLLHGLQRSSNDADRIDRIHLNLVDADAEGEIRTRRLLAKELRALSADADHKREHTPGLTGDDKLVLTTRAMVLSEAANLVEKHNG